jgi:hypothetical protein
MLKHLGTGPYQAHITQKHIQYLWQFVQLPSAQKTTYRSELLVGGRRDSIVHGIRGVDQASEFEDGEAPAITAHPLLQK